MKNSRCSFEERLKTYEEKLANKTEKWKYIYINDIKTKYAISNFGNIVNCKNGKLHNFENYDTNHYRRFSFKFGEISIKFDVHRLVAIYFCKIPKRYLEQGLTYKDLVVNHKNGIKFCNASFNLEWLLPKENTYHAWKTGLCDNIRGEKTHLAKITENQAIEICELIMKKKTNKEISEITDINKKTIQHIRSGECWKHITSQYKFPKLGNAKPYSIPENIIHEICKKLELKEYTNQEIANMYNVNRRLVNSIRNREIRKNISKDYNF